MNKKDFDIRNALIQSGKKEFLEKGYEKASLRRICKNAGVTTGSFYAYFSRKEELFAAIVDPVLQNYYRMYDSVFRNSMEDIQSNRSNEQTAIDFICAHRDEFRLLFDCSAETEYEGFREKLIDEIFMPTYQACFDNYLNRHVDPDIVRIFMLMKFSEYMELIFGGYPMEKVRSLTGLYSAYADSGIERMKEILKNTSE